jgi:hypothetical protein
MTAKERCKLMLKARSPLSATDLAKAVLSFPGTTSSLLHKGMGVDFERLAAWSKHFRATPVWVYCLKGQAGRNNTGYHLCRSLKIKKDCRYIPRMMEAYCSDLDYYRKLSYDQQAKV